MLQHANVETFIVFRSVTPIVVAIADAIFRPYAATLPSARTGATLLLIFVGAVGYVQVDSSFSAHSYLWGSIYVTVFCMEMARPEPSEPRTLSPRVRAFVCCLRAGRHSPPPQQAASGRRSARG